ncbi:hypothetical protein N9995_00290 [bacterium]|jgi:hypothetical protein|nr:hypothetical protein [bacterium]
MRKDDEMGLRDRNAQNAKCAQLSVLSHRSQMLSQISGLDSFRRLDSFSSSCGSCIFSLSFRYPFCMSLGSLPTELKYVEGTLDSLDIKISRRLFDL